jgi:hypothetical protein
VDDVLKELSPEEAKKLVGEDEGLGFEAIVDIANELAKGTRNGVCLV